MIKGTTKGRCLVRKATECPDRVTIANRLVGPVDQPRSGLGVVGPLNADNFYTYMDLLKAIPVVETSYNHQLNYVRDLQFQVV